MATRRDAVPPNRGTSPTLFEGAGLTVSLVAGLPAEEVARRIALAHRVGEVCNRALAFYLHDLHERRLYQAWGFSSAAQYARQRIGMSKTRAHELLATGAQLHDLPRLDEAFARGELSWSRVRRVARVANADTEQAWIERVRDISLEEVEALVSATRAGELPPKLDQGLPRTRFVVRLVMGATRHEMFELARQKLQCELGVGAIGDADLLGEMVRLFLSSDADGSVPGRKRVDGSLFRATADAVDPEHEGARSDAAVSGRLRRRVLERDGGQCQSCTSRRSPMVHHVVWRSHGGRTTPENLVTLCARCHALVHDELLFVSGRPGCWEFGDRHGRALRGQISESGVVLQAESTAVDSAARESTDAARLTSVDDIPDEVDSEWWRRHAHLLEWTSNGMGVRLRRDPSGDRSA